MITRDAMLYIYIHKIPEPAIESSKKEELRTRETRRNETKRGFIFPTDRRR